MPTEEERAAPTGPPARDPVEPEPAPPPNPPPSRGRALDVLSDDELATRAWAKAAHSGQTPPDDDWTTWVFLGGRGAGKTRAGAEWVWETAQALGPGGRIAIVGATLHDARTVMTEGPSGLLRLPFRAGARYEPSLRRVVFPGGAVGLLFSAGEPERLRGPQFHAAWGDEFCAWDYAEEALAMLRLGVRLGVRPQLVLTSTPKPRASLRRVLAGAGCARTDAATRENARNLAPGFLAAMEGLYGGTRRAAQELEGRVLEAEGALFTLAEIEKARALGAGLGRRAGAGDRRGRSAGGDAVGAAPGCVRDRGGGAARGPGEGAGRLDGAGAVAGGLGRPGAAGGGGARGRAGGGRDQQRRGDGRGGAEGDGDDHAGQTGARLDRQGRAGRARGGPVRAGAGFSCAGAGGAGGGTDGAGRRGRRERQPGPGRCAGLGGDGADAGPRREPGAEHTAVVSRYSGWRTSIGRPRLSSWGRTTEASPTTTQTKRSGSMTARAAASMSAAVRARVRLARVS